MDSLVIKNDRTLLQKAVRLQRVPGELGAAAYAVPKRTLKFM